MHNPGCIQRENGAALVISLLLLAVLLLVGSGALTTSRIETQIAGNDEKIKQALLTAEYALALGENALERATEPPQFGAATGSEECGFTVKANDPPPSSSGRYPVGTQPKWNKLTWDDRDSIDVTTYFAPADPTAPPLPPPLVNAHARPRVVIAAKCLRRDGPGFAEGAGVWYFDVAAHGGQSKWTALGDNCKLEPDATKACKEDRPGEKNPEITYTDRYHGTRVIIQSVYAKRYR